MQEGKQKYKSIHALLPVHIGGPHSKLELEVKLSGLRRILYDVHFDASLGCLAVRPGLRQAMALLDFQGLLRDES